MSDELWKRYREADQLHSAGLISDEEMNEVAAVHFAQVMADEAVMPPKTARAKQARKGRPRILLGTEAKPITDLWLDVPRAKLARISNASRALPPEKRKEAAFDAARRQRWDAVSIAILAGKNRNISAWSHEIVATYLGSHEQQEEYRQLIERWLRNSSEHGLPDWIRTRLEPLFPRRKGSSVTGVSSKKTAFSDT